MSTTGEATPSASEPAASPPRAILPAIGLALEAVAVGAVLLDGPTFSRVAWLPGWAGLTLALLRFRSGGAARVVVVATGVLFAAGTVLGVAAAVR